MAADKGAIAASSARHAAKRDAYFKDIKIHWDSQNKHIRGKHNFEVGRGEVTLQSSELEDLVKKHAGSGQRVTGSIGEPNFKERVDFGKIIGEYALEIKDQPTQYLSTSKGIIHYNKKGSVHVVPSDPGAIIK